MEISLRTVLGETPRAELGSGNFFSRPTLALREAIRLRERSMELRRKSAVLENLGMTTRGASWLYGQTMRESASSLLREAQEIDELTESAFDQGEIAGRCPGCGQWISLRDAVSLGDGTRVCAQCKATAELRG